MENRVSQNHWVGNTVVLVDVSSRTRLRLAVLLAEGSGCPALMPSNVALVLRMLRCGAAGL